MPTSKPATARAITWILISSCCFGSLSTLTLFTTRSGLPLLPAMLWRYCLAALILLIALRGTIVGHARSPLAWRLMLIGGVGQAVITYLSLRALDYLPVGPLGFLFYTYPAWVAVISAITGRERITLPRLIALLTAMAGIFIMVGAPTAATLNMTGVFLALGTALLYALYLPSLHHAQANLPAGVSTFFLILGALMAFFVANMLTHQIQIPRSLEIWKYLFLLSTVSTVIAFGALIAGLHVLGPVRTSIVASVEPFFTTILGVILLGDVLTLAILIGGAMIAAAVIILEWTGRDRTSPVAV